MSDPSDFCIGCMNDEYPEGLRKEIETIRQQLAESQAEAERYKAAWESSHNQAMQNGHAALESQARGKVQQGALDWINSRFPDASALVVIREALALPSDSTALDSAIRQAKREALLECDAKFWCYDNVNDVQAELRRMADELK